MKKNTYNYFYYNYYTLIISQTESECFPHCHLFTFIQENNASPLCSHLEIHYLCMQKIYPHCTQHMRPDSLKISHVNKLILVTVYHSDFSLI